MNQNITDEELRDLSIEVEPIQFTIDDIVIGYLEKTYPLSSITQLRKYSLYSTLVDFLTFVNTLPDPEGYEDSF